MGAPKYPLTCPPPKRLRKASIWSCSSFWKRGLTWSQEEEGSPLQGQHPQSYPHTAQGGTACITPTTYSAHTMPRRQGAGEVVAQDEAVWGDAELALDGQADARHVGL